jgi:Ca2+-binding RTX toxin-like protein
MMFENLENRSMLSATLANGVLTVTGTAQKDSIHVVEAGKNLKVSVNGVKPVTFAKTAVKSLVVNALAGNDVIELGRGVPAAVINGGDGNDRIRGTDNADTIDAGAGNDWVSAGRGNDSVTGGDGNDVLVGGEGNDTIRGGNGNDFIDGDAGNDSIFGDAGNDILVGGRGDDKVDGGAGTDLAIKQKKDAKDVFTAVEKIRP